jgi:hypothetical protein
LANFKVGISFKFNDFFLRKTGICDRIFLSQNIYGKLVKIHHPKKTKRKQKDWVTLPHASKNPIKRTNYKPAENDEEPCM